MRKLVISSCILLILSGILIYGVPIFLPAVSLTAAATLHLWLGMFFLVIFPMYAFDHIYGHRQRLKRFNMVSASGLIQLLAGVILIITGLILFLYGLQAPEQLRFQHHFWTYPLIIALLAHRMSKKR